MACDMKSVSQYVGDGMSEVVMVCVSLLGKNIGDYIFEVKPCLPIRGSMAVAENNRFIVYRRTSL